MSHFNTNTAEFIPISQAARSMGEYIKSLQEKVQDKYIIVKNNTPEAVLMDVKQYEQLMAKIDELEGLIEDYILENQIKARMQDKRNLKEAVSLDELVKRHDLQE